MRDRLRRWLPVLKVLLAAAILVGVALLFLRVLQSEELRQADRTRTPGEILWGQLCSARPATLVLAGVLYLVGLLFSGLFWVVLLYRVKEPLPLTTALRAYYISHLGKYAPLGKGWALLMRTSFSVSGGIRASTAALTGTYETLTTMAAGALLASLLVLWQVGNESGLLWQALGLLALAGIPIVPGVFNPIVRRLSARFMNDPAMWPRLSSWTLLLGLGMTGCGWALLGGSLALTVAAFPDVGIGGEAVLWLHCTAFVAISYVAGFIASTPGGLGVRELVLQQLLAPQLGAKAVVVVVMLRLLWTAAELVLAGLMYWVPAPAVLSPAVANESGP